MHGYISRICKPILNCSISFWDFAPLPPLLQGKSQKIQEMFAGKEGFCNDEGAVVPQTDVDPVPHTHSLTLFDNVQTLWW